MCEVSSFWREESVTSPLSLEPFVCVRACVYVCVSVCVCVSSSLSDTALRYAYQ